MARALSLLAACVALTAFVETGLGAGPDRTAATKAGRDGVAALVAGRFTDAVDSLKKATKLQPDNRTWWLNLGWALNALKRSAEAIQAFNQATGLTKPSEYYVMGQILWGLADAHENQKDCAGMTRHLKKWMALTDAQSPKVRGRKAVKDQLAVARQRIQICPKRAVADRRR